MKSIVTRSMISLVLIGIFFLSSCKKENEFLDEAIPTDFLTNDQAYASSKLVESILANLYNRQVDFSSVKDWASMLDFSESMPGEDGVRNVVQNSLWGYTAWFSWDYAYIRDMNLFLERMAASTSFNGTDEQRKAFLAEARFLRANYYFEMTKRVGGVPLILESLSYDFKGDPSYLQFPRAKEQEVYDFIIREMEEIKAALTVNASLKDRPTKAAALALQARAALYAASIAKHGASTPSVSLPGGEVGINAALANGYYEQALTAAQSIINQEVGTYSLYNKIPTDLSQNFAALFYDKSNNPEIIWMEDFKLATDKRHGFTINCQPFFRAEDIDEGGGVLPSLNLAQEFELLNNTFSSFSTIDGSGNPIYYANPEDIFAGRDARLKGTIITPGSAFKNNTTDIWAGYKLTNGSIVTASQPGGRGNLPGGPQNTQVVGNDGPIDGLRFVAQTGFYIRKFLDPTVGSGQRNTGSAVPNIRYRYAEVLLNAAEAAYELGRPEIAVTYINQVRRRAGFATDLTPAQISFDRIVHERRVELAFEGHLLYDRKRWRIAHLVWDGVPMTEMDLLNNIGVARKRNTQPFCLLPYKYYNPGNINDGKYLFVINKSSIVTGVNNFRFGNYYSQIEDNLIARNPKLVKQPNQ